MAKKASILFNVLARAVNIIMAALRLIPRTISSFRFLSSVAPSQARVSFPVERMPLLEELLEVPVLRTGEMRAESLAEVKGFVPPVLPDQIETCLSAEFDRSILETDWNRYEDVTNSHEQAARLLHYTLAIYSNVGKSAVQKPEEIKALASGNQEWIKTECQLMLKEIQDGDYSRWEAAEKLLGEMHGKLSEAQRKAVMPALAIIAKNAWLHPKTKAQVLAEICRVVSATVKQ